jgi:WD40 repeat protein
MKTINTVVILLASVLLISCGPKGNAISNKTMVPPTVVQVQGDPIFDAALSQDGSKLAVYANSGVYVYDTETSSKTVFRDFSNLDYSKYEGKEPAGAIAFSSDGNTIAISGKYPDTPVELWDLRTGKYVVDITDIPPAYQVTRIQFSPDDKSLFIRNNYDWSMRCEQADANFALVFVQK